MEREHDLARFEEAAAFLPEHLRVKVMALPDRAKLRAEEFRLRRGRPLFITYPQGEQAIAGTKVTEAELEAVLALGSNASVHTVLEQVRHGFISLRGGHRLGLCGTGVVERGEVINLKDISSLCLRIAKERKGLANPLVPRLFEGGRMKNTLIFSPPAGGKTTLLRDMIRCVSEGENCAATRVGLIDERGEVAGMWNGSATLNVGPRTDVLDRVSKAKGIHFLLKSMNPQLIALDEVTEEEDLTAMGKAVGCGVSLLTTAHAGEFSDFSRRELYRNMLNSKIFERFVQITLMPVGRNYRVFNDAGEELC